MINSSPIHDNIEAMLRLSGEFQEVRVMGSLAEWRVVEGRPVGEVTGVWEDVRLLATDGIAAFFLRGSGEVVYGHLHCFKKDKKERNAGGRRPVRVSLKRQHLENLAMED